MSPVKEWSRLRSTLRPLTAAIGSSMNNLFLESVYHTKCWQLLRLLFLPLDDESFRTGTVVGRQRGTLGLTRAQSKSTASSMSSWWPIRDTPKSSSSWWVIRSNWSPPTFSFSKVLMYCCRQSSRPGGNTQQIFQNSLNTETNLFTGRIRFWGFTSQTPSCKASTNNTSLEQL